MYNQQRDTISSAPECVTETVPSYTPLAPPSTSLPVIHTGPLIRSRPDTQHSFESVVLPVDGVASEEFLAREEQRIGQMTSWCEKYRDWQTRLVLVVIAKYSAIQIVHLFNTVLLPYLHPHKYTDSVFLNGNLKQLDISSLPLSVRSADFFPSEQLRWRRKVKRVKRPKTIVLVREFRDELKSLQRWVGYSWYTPLLLIKFIGGLVRVSSHSQLQLFASCLQERLTDRVELYFMSDATLTKIFSYLSPHSLSLVSAVSKSWRVLALNSQLWRQHVATFGEKEGILNLDRSVALGLSDPIDWRAVYTQLHKIRRDVREGVCEEIRDLYQRREGTGVEKVTISPELPSAPPPCTTSPLSCKGKKPSRKAGLRDLLSVVQETHNYTNKGCIVPEQALRSVPLSERDRRAQEVANKKPTQSSNIPLLPLIECKDTPVTSLHRTTSKSYPTPLLPPASNPVEHRRVLHARVHKDVYWRVFDFIQSRYNCSSDPRSYTCLALAGCIPNIHVSNQDTTLPSPLFPLSSVRLFTQTPQQPLYSVACDSRRVLVSSTDLNVRLFDSRSGREIGCLEGHKGVVNCIAVTHGIVVTGSWDSTVTVWDAVSFQMMYVIHAHSESVTQVTVNNDVVVSCCKDGEVCVWRRGSWDLLTCLVLHKKSVTGLVLTDKHIYTSSLDGTVGIWNINSYKRVAVLTIGSLVTCMTVKQGLCVVGCDTGYVRLWNLSSLREEMRLSNSSPELYEQIMSTFLCRDTETTSQESISIKQLDVYVMVDCTKPAPIRYVVVSNSFVFATNGAALYQWSLATCSLARVMLAHAASITCLAADRHKVVSVGEDGRVVLWHTRNKPLNVSHSDETLIIYGDMKRIQI